MLATLGREGRFVRGVLERLVGQALQRRHGTGQWPQWPGEVEIPLGNHVCPQALKDPRSRCSDASMKLAKFRGLHECEAPVLQRIA